MLKEKLKQTRIDKKFSQQDMAKHLNISQPHYLRKEKGEIEIRDEEWERMAKLLDVEVDDIKETDREKFINQSFENVTDITNSMLEVIIFIVIFLNIFLQVNKNTSIF